MRKPLLTLIFLLMKLIISSSLVYLAYWWPGQQETTLSFVDHVVDIKTGVMAAGLLLVIFSIHYGLQLLRYLISLPQGIRAYLQERRFFRAQEAAWKSFIAMKSGEHQLALEMARDARLGDPKNQLATYLYAKNLWLSGRVSEAEIFFQELLARPEYRFLSLKCLIEMKERVNSSEDLGSYLREAFQERPASPWVSERLLKYLMERKVFQEAQEVLQKTQRAKTFPKEQQDEWEATVNSNQGRFFIEQGCLEEGLGYSWALNEAEVFLIQALKKNPKYTQAVLDLCKLYTRLEKHGKAINTLIKGYGCFPHKDYLGAIKSLEKGKNDKPLTPLEKFQLAEEMTIGHNGIIPTYYILTYLALEAGLWGQAKHYLIKWGNLEKTPEYHHLMEKLNQASSPRLAGDPRRIEA